VKIIIAVLLLSGAMQREANRHHETTVSGKIPAR
jgi:hypothetical protein